MAEYVMNVGMNYTLPGEAPIGETGAVGKRVEAGDVVSDLDPHFTGECGPSCALDGEHGWGLKDGHISPASPPPAEMVETTTFGDEEPTFLVVKGPKKKAEA